MKLNIPVIAMSAHEDKSFEKKCQQSGFKEVVSKPINREKLNSIVKKFLLPTVAPKKRVEKQITVRTKKTKDGNYINISNLLKVTQNNMNLRMSTYKKFSENVTKLYQLLMDNKLSVLESEILRRELHSFINLAHYFCKSEIVTKAKKAEQQIKNKSREFIANKDNFSLLVGDLKKQLESIHLNS